ncbi:MAG: alkaline phosphatase family protein [Deltaproteobacteria bacterium]|nr:alkaline phosphatase family protein [Deltaproteobacteria bacterium]
MTSSNPPARRAVLFLVDGMRPDGLQAAETPFLDRLIGQGAHTYQARTVMPSTTLTCHTSLFFSIPPETHGILDNVWKPFARDNHGLFQLLREAGLTAATFFNWEQLRDLWQPGSLAASLFLKDAPGDDGRTDRELSSLAFSWLSSHDWAFAFVYLHNTDKAGHASGWMSAAYLEAISNADRCIESICGSLPEDALVIVAADHGGHDHTHHTDLEEDMTVPLILRGPGIPKNLEIPGKVGIMDIAPTVARFLGLAWPDAWQGRAISF